MDHWGDPWADNANDKSPTKNAVTSPLPPAFTFAPVPLNGFVDDAGWGDNDDDGFGDWAAGDTGNGAANGLETPAADEAPGSAGWGTVTHGQSEDWPEIVSPMPRVLDKVDSEPSDSSTVAQLEEAIRQNEDEDEDEIEDSTPTPQAEVESSVRSSTSPSETSRHELPIESPRTSVEDERAVGKDEMAQQEVSAVSAEPNAADTVSEMLSEANEKGQNDIKVIDDEQELAADTRNIPEDATQRPSVDIREPKDDGNQDSAHDVATAKDAPPSNSQPTFSYDSTLLAQLFPSSEETGKELEEHGDSIFSTSARKAWYRLTRKQTMREFNHGENDDNYVRVTWTNSNVRTEVNKVVSRWAREDRISGTGPGARASFYWDTPAPAEPKAPFGHLRTQSSVPATKTALPARQSLPPLATNQSAAFDWSSPASADPWKIESPTQRSTSTPLALKNPTVAKLQRQEGRAVSVDLTPRRSEQTTHKRTATVSHPVPETKAVPNLISPPIIQPSAESSDPWANLDTFDSPSTFTIEVADTPIDDDDDWGEMVQTPTLPTAQQLDPFSQPSTTNDILPSPPLPKPSPPVNTPVQGEPTEPMVASPIVRLRSTISPTSALFKANTFVPLHAEQGPIGPGLLKPANRNSRSAPDKKLEINTSVAPNAESVPMAAVAARANENGSNEILSFLDASDPVTPPPKFEEVRVAPAEAANLTPIAQPATPVQASADSWADADLSFFEPALPATAPQQPLQTQDPSDPFFFFDTPAPTSTRPPSRSFSRSPPRDIAPPPLQPLTNATGFLQRRKAEEDQIISDILSELPDLSYMLR